MIECLTYVIIIFQEKSILTDWELETVKLNIK